MPTRHHRNRDFVPAPTRRFEHHDDALPIDADLAPDDPAEPSVGHRPTQHVRRSRQVDVLAAIAGGGFLGTLGRYEAELAWPAQSGRPPWTTFAINTSGAFLLGLILTVLLERSRPTRYPRPFFCVGVLGAWTTMSTFAVETDLLVRDGHAGAAAIYVLATIVVGVTATGLGIGMARRFVPRTLR